MAHTDELFKQIISGRTLDNCSIGASDVTNAQTIFGPNHPGLKGKTVRQRPEKNGPEYLGIPRDFHRVHHFVTLTADVMFVNGLAFFTTLGRDIRFGTAEHVPSQMAKQLAKSLMKIVNRIQGMGLYISPIFDRLFSRLNRFANINTQLASSSSLES